jgi:hypothetical protein
MMLVSGRTLVLRVLLLLCSLLAERGSAAMAAQHPFSKEDWLADYASLKQELERSYSHLAWFGSPQSGTDLVALDGATRSALEHAATDTDASVAITRFVEGVRDGHFAATAAPSPVGGTFQEPPLVERAADARTACAAFGYAPVTRIGFSLPFESLSGFELTSDGVTTPFRAGIIEQGERRFGIVRIPRFRPAEFPQLCESTWQSLRARHIAPTRSAIRDHVDAEWLHALGARLRELSAKRVNALVIDIAGNGGGNDLGDWAVRLFTRSPVHSAPMLLAASAVAIPYFDEQLEGLGRVLNANDRLPTATRAALEQAVSDFRRRKRDASGVPCDMSWVWHEQRAWGTSPCTRLIASGFASGALDYLEPGRLDAQAALALYWPGIADRERGAWSGPAYVLTDASTGSAAEMFAALMRDRGIAKTVGLHTFGLGCGYMDYDAPFVLPHSGRAFNIPNCVRLRSDGTDDVAGVAPDLPVDLLDGESTRGRAVRALNAIAADLTGSRR